jgi:lysozyme
MSDAVGTGFSRYPLWVANYGVSCPKMPDGWDQWRFWQSSESGTVSGIDGATDLDTFQGTMDDLVDFVKSSAAPPKPEPSGN